MSSCSNKSCTILSNSTRRGSRQPTGSWRLSSKFLEFWRHQQLLSLRVLLGSLDQCPGGFRPHSLTFVLVQAVVHNGFLWLHQSLSCGELTLSGVTEKCLFHLCRTAIRRYSWAFAPAWSFWSLVSAHCLSLQAYSISIVRLLCSWNAMRTRMTHMATCFST